jgi:hypothetical protein
VAHEESLVGLSLYSKHMISYVPIVCMQKCGYFLVNANDASPVVSTKFQSLCPFNRHLALFSLTRVHVLPKCTHSL